MKLTAIQVPAIARLFLPRRADSEQSSSLSYPFLLKLGAVTATV